MTADQINAKIAELCGWTSIRFVGGEPMGRPPQTTDRYDVLPNYHDSLDACASFEAMLDDKSQGDYVDWFWHNLEPLEDHGPNPESESEENIMIVGVWQILTATAPQRCAAFLKIHGIDV